MTESNKDTPIEWDKFPGTLENPSDFRKGSGDYGVTFAVPVKHVGYIQPLMEKAQRAFAVFIVPASSLDQAEALLREKKSEPQGITDGSGVSSQSSDFFVSVEALAQVLGVDPRTVQLDAEKGVLVRTGRGQYDTLASCGTLRKALKEAETGHNDVYNDERTQSMRLKRQERELNYLERAGKLVNSEAVMRVIEKAKAAEKQQLLFMPKQLAPLLEGDPAVDEVILEEWAHQFLKGQTEINIVADIVSAPEADQDKMPQMPKKKRRKKKK